MLAIEGLTKTFGQNTAVDAATFTVDEPKMIGIIGRSGAGKSTLLRMINRLTDATSGVLSFEGRNVLELTGKERRNWQSDCAMIFQQFNLVPRMDVVSNVLHGTLGRMSTAATLFNLFPRDDIHKALDILERLGIAEHAAKRAEALSGGQQQRVAIARAVMQNPKIVLADEPIASLDPMNAQLVMEDLRRIHEEDGRMVIANLHTLDTARRYCDRIIGMRDGKIVFDGTPDQLTTGAARDIYGAGDEFSEAATSTELRDHEPNPANVTPIAQAQALPTPFICPDNPNTGRQPMESMMKKLIAAALATTALTGTAFGEGIEGFNIGILGGENAQDRLANHECLKEYTEEALGVPVKLFAPADYAGVIEGLLGGTIDMAWLGASGYAKTYLSDPEAVEPVLVKINLDGSYGYHSIGFARVDSGITSLDDMAGKVFGFGDPNSTSGYLIPSIEIPMEGDAITMESGDYFGEVKFTGGHEQTIVAVNNGDIDGGVTWADGQGAWEDGFNSGALRKAVDAGLIDMNDLVEIWRSKPIPEGPIVLRTALPQDVKDTMTALIDGMYDADKECTYNISAGESLGFDPITHDAYVSIIEARKAKSN